ncbi:MAG TPA: YdeI/OmpD-associated family protein [Steroidobacteraceae bacterium]|nr:YdeI/OmpD-associated family protein [Steroidobacteraceae bacterium]
MAPPSWPVHVPAKIIAYYPAGSPSTNVRESPDNVNWELAHGHEINTVTLIAQAKSTGGGMARVISKRAAEHRHFRSAQQFRYWLAKEHARANGVLVQIFKKNSGVVSISYAEALDQALCFGWIDGQKLPLDAKSWVQKFTPRRPKSRWSKKNVEHADRLIRSGHMTPAGLKQVQAAREDGRWAAAYDSPANASVPAEFVEELERNHKAKQLYSSLNKANLYAISYRLQTAKRPETKHRRMKQIIDMLARGETFH